MGDGYRLRRVHAWLTWYRREKIATDRAVAFLSHGFGEGDEKPFIIRPVPKPRNEDVIAFDIRCDDPNFLIPRGNTELFSVRADNVSSNAVNLTARFRVLTYLDRKPVSSRDMPIKLTGGKSHPLSLAAKLSKPGMYRAELTVRDAEKELRKLEWAFVYDWQHWDMPTTRPADFNEFWQQTLEELRSQPLDAVVTPQADQSGCKICHVNFRSLGERRVYGWYIVPPGDGPFPAALILPGNGVYQMPFNFTWPHGRYALLVIQVHGYDVDLSNFPKVWPWKHSHGNYWSEWESREQAFARIVYANCTRAVDFLMSRPEVNKDELYLEGGSQGGGLAIITAALNPAIKSVYINAPGLCRLDWLYPHFLDAPFPWNGKSPKPSGMSDKELLRIMSYYDAANFVPDIRCPITANIALQDSVTIGGTALAAFRNTRAPLTLVNGIWMNHRVDDRMNEAHLKWLKQTVLK